MRRVQQELPGQRHPGRRWSRLRYGDHQRMVAGATHREIRGRMLFLNRDKKEKLDGNSNNRC
jgi:hypothetical protein